MAGNYDDIINLPHHISEKHTPMSRENRAAQFGSFQALSGYEDSVKEEARLTSTKEELSEEQLNELDRKAAFLKDNIALKPEITVTYFVSDIKKNGGKYVALKGNLYKIDITRGEIIFTDKRKIPLSDIVKIDSELFKEDFS